MGEKKEKIKKIIQGYNDEALAQEIRNGSDRYSPEALEMLKQELRKRTRGIRTPMAESGESKSEIKKQRTEPTNNLAELKKRITAYIYDGFLLWLPLVVIIFIFLGRTVQVSALTDTIALMNQLQPKLIFIFPILFLYAGILVGKFGWTLGKRYTNIAVVRAGNFEKVNFPRAFLREGIKFGLHFIPYVGFLVLLVNIFLIIYSPRRQAIHDIIAGTQVINIPADNKKKKILNLVVIILFVLFFFSLFYVVVYAPN